MYVFSDKHLIVSGETRTSFLLRGWSCRSSLSTHSVTFRLLTYFRRYGVDLGIDTCVDPSILPPVDPSVDTYIDPGDGIGIDTRIDTGIGISVDAGAVLIFGQCFCRLYSFSYLASVKP